MAEINKKKLKSYAVSYVLPNMFLPLTIRIEAENKRDAREKFWETSFAKGSKILNVF